MSVIVLSEAFDALDQQRILLSDSSGAAVATFTGYVRDLCEQGSVRALELEHYPGMTQRSLEDIGAAAQGKFSLKRWRIVHRYGLLSEGEAIVWVGVVADHRGEAFAGCEFIMDHLKTQAPYWKREHLTDGRAHWVAAKEADERQQQTWQEHSS